MSKILFGLHDLLEDDIILMNDKTQNQLNLIQILIVDILGLNLNEEILAIGSFVYFNLLQIFLYCDHYFSRSVEMGGYH